MQHPNSVTENMHDTDALFDTSPAAMASRFGEKAIRLVRDGLPVAGTARLAASYAFLVRPDLREGAPTFADTLFALGIALARQTSERVH